MANSPTTAEPALPAILRPWMAFALPALGVALTGYFASATGGSDGAARLLLWLALGMAATMPAVVVHFQLRGFQGRAGPYARTDPVLGPAAGLTDESGDPVRSPVLVPDTCDLAGVAGAVRDALKDGIRRKGLSLDVLVDPQVKQPVIADAHHLAQALTNLAAHVIEGTEHGGITVRVTMLDPSMSGYLMRFSVEDTGAGISRELQASLFGPRARRCEPGFALGEAASRLETARAIAELMGSRLRVSREPGVGERYWFDLRLPLATGWPRGDTDRRTPSTVGAKRVLIASANPVNLPLVREVLANDGHEVSVAESGGVALELLQSSAEWDVVFLDADLPDMPAETLAKTYRFGASKPAPIHLLDNPADIDGVRRMVAVAARRQRQDDDATLPALRAVPVVYVDEAAIDRLAAVGTRPDFLAELITRTIAGLGQGTRELVAALDAGEFERVRDAAHALEGLAREVGAVRLERLVASAIRQGARDLESGRRRLVGELRETVDRTVETLAMLESRLRSANTGTTG